MKSGVLDNLLHFKGPYRFLKISSTLENKKNAGRMNKITVPQVHFLKSLSNCDAILVEALKLCIYVLLCSGT